MCIKRKSSKKLENLLLTSVYKATTALFLLTVKLAQAKRILSRVKLIKLGREIKIIKEDCCQDALSTCSSKYAK